MTEETKRYLLSLTIQLIQNEIKFDLDGKKYSYENTIEDIQTLYDSLADIIQD